MKPINNRYGNYFLICMISCFLCVSGNASKDSKEIKSYSKKINDWSDLSEREMTAYITQQINEAKINAIFYLKTAKVALINGDINLSKFFINKISDRNKKMLPIKKRYLSIINFIEGNYKRSYDLIKGFEFNSFLPFQEICLLRIANLIALDDLKAFNKEVAACQIQTIKFSTNNQFWLEQLYRIKNKNERLLKGNLVEGLRTALNSTELTEIWMKLALFLNKEEYIIKYVGQLPSSSYRSNIVRELIGFAYYRNENDKEALNFVEDIEGTNAYNIRANINFDKGKHEIAYGLYKLALQKKQNSQNALERGIPLSYILGQWDEGLSMLKRLVGKNINKKKSLTLETLFNVRKGEIKKSQANILYLNKLYNEELPREVNLLESYISLITSDNPQLFISSDRACKWYDGLHCWITLQGQRWEDLGRIIKRDDKTLSLKKWDPNMHKKPLKITPLKESIFIDQKDIEELDSEEVKIIP